MRQWASGREGTDAVLSGLILRRVAAGAALVVWSLLAVASHAGAPLPVERGGWPVYGGNEGGAKYSPLSQVTTDNVTALELAWEYRTGDSQAERGDVPPTSFLATPILHDNTLYFCSGLSRAFAIDAETGKERWVFDSKSNTRGSGTTKCRGVALWHDGKRSSAGTPCASRVFMGTLDGRLAALDAASGRACADFGTGGFVDLRQGLGPVVGNDMAVTSPPVVIGDLVVQGSMIRDNQRVDSPGGVIRAWDARSGELRWAFDPVPPGAPTPRELGAPDGQVYHSGTPNAWTILSVDAELGLVYVPFGTPGLDFIGGHRTADGFDRGYYANAVVALRAATGEVAWHFQTVHHDLWDYDLGSQPVLVDIERDGEAVPALLQATKMGHLFVLDRRTGEPLYPVEERPVPQTAIPGEFTSPTQPFPTFPPPFHPHRFTDADIFGITVFDRDACRDKLAAADNRGIFTPPALDRYSVQYPGVAGGQNWGGLAVDRDNNVIVLPQNHVVTFNKIVRREDILEGAADDGFMGFSPNRGSPYVIKHEVLLSPLGMPCLRPPWGTLLAVSMDSGEKIWEVPLGSPRDMVPALSWFPFFPETGLPSAGGPIVTAGGLVFIGAAMDNYLRAYDVRSGKLLWRHRLPAGGQATPMTYRGERSGDQFVVIAAGGHAYMRTTPGDSLLAFRLRH